VEPKTLGVANEVVDADANVSVIANLRPRRLAVRGPSPRTPDCYAEYMVREQTGEELPQ
jgi:hypothetical protein